MTACDTDWAKNGETRRIRGERPRGAAKAILLTAVLAAGPVEAQAVNEVFLDVTYFGSPSGWCAANDGVLVIMTLDRPEIIAGSKASPKSVHERVGGKRLDTACTGEGDTKMTIAKADQTQGTEKI